MTKIRKERLSIAADSMINNVSFHKTTVQKIGFHIFHEWHSQQQTLELLGGIEKTISVFCYLCKRNMKECRSIYSRIIYDRSMLELKVRNKKQNCKLFDTRESSSMCHSGRLVKLSYSAHEQCILLH